MTYIHTAQDGWCYLSSIMDLYSRKIIAWTLGKTMETELVLKTLESVKDRENKDLILQTNLGSQYTNGDYEKCLSVYQVKHSYNQKGYPYDN